MVPQALPVQSQEEPSSSKGMNTPQKINKNLKPILKGHSAPDQRVRVWMDYLRGSQRKSDKHLYLVQMQGMPSQCRPHLLLAPFPSLTDTPKASGAWKQMAVTSEFLGPRTPPVMGSVAALCGPRLISKWL